MLAPRRSSRERTLSATTPKRKSGAKTLAHISEIELDYSAVGSVVEI
jgi:hypothetical protein